MLTTSTNPEEAVDNAVETASTTIGKALSGEHPGLAEEVAARIWRRLRQDIIEDGKGVGIRQAVSAP